MTDTDEYTGVIVYPCCPREKVLVKRGTLGAASQKCPHCGKYVLFDYNKMTAELIRPVRGAARHFVDNSD